MMSNASVSVVVPVYNSRPMLPELAARVEEMLSACAREFEVILVNDGSCDGSWEAICDIARERPWIWGIDLMRNYGQHNALLCGIRAARHELIVTMDDDLQHPPEEIPKLLDKLSEGYDVIYGTPQEEQHGIWRGLASQITKLALQSTMGVQTARNVSAFRAFRAPVRQAFDHYRGPFASIDVLLTWGTTKFAAVPVRHDRRPVGESNYTFRKLVTHAFNMMTGFAVLPLKLASWVGMVFALFGGLVLAYVLARYLVQGQVVPGFAFLASIIAILSGAQLLSLGIIGEYLARMHFRLMSKPGYTVRESLMGQE